MARSHEDFVDIVKIKNPSVEIVGIYTIRIKRFTMVYH